MGNAAGIIQNTEDGTSVSNSSTVVEFKKLPSSQEARAKFEEEGTLAKNSSVGLLSLRAMLDDPYAQKALGKYSASEQSPEFLMCWTELQEFKSIAAGDYRLSTAIHLYHKYVKTDAIADLGLLSAEEISEYSAELSEVKQDPTKLDSDFFVRLQSRCLMNLYQQVYLPFTNTPEFIELTVRLKKKYNHVRVKDFEFYEKLGQGGFGLVVHCRKISTGKHYAMKIQRKKGLIDCFRHDHSRILFEKQALASCQHPFIVNLDYAFQSNTLTMLCLGLSRAGDLQKALAQSPNVRLPESRVKYYVAEIVLAISHLHQLGLVYRDLKPGNVLLDEDGHIRLVDMGGVSNVDGSSIRKNKDDADGKLVPLFSGGVDLNDGTIQGHTIQETREEGEEREDEGTKNADVARDLDANSKAQEARRDAKIERTGETKSTYVAEVNADGDVVIANIKTREGTSTSLSVSEDKQPVGGDKEAKLDGEAAAINASGPKRDSNKPTAKEKSMSVMGTLGYMAPEMVVMLSQRKGEKTTYNEVVDWWSLGATIYKLLTGSRAFTDEQFSSYVGMATTMIEMVVMHMDSMEYVKLFSKIQFPAYVSIAAQDLISKLLDVSPKTRLGAKPGGVNDIKSHPFFTGIDWTLLEQKHVLPPFVPTVNETTVEPMRFEEFMENENKSAWLTDSVGLEDKDKLFTDWDFISPNMLRIEAGLSAVMSQYDKKFKVKSLDRERSVADLSSSKPSLLGEMKRRFAQLSRKKVYESGSNSSD